MKQKQIEVKGKCGTYVQLSDLEIEKLLINLKENRRELVEIYINDNYHYKEPISFELYCVEIENIPYYNDLAIDEFQDVYKRYNEYIKE